MLHSALNKELLGMAADGQNSTMASERTLNTDY